jgi:hypothetical protein
MLICVKRIKYKYCNLTHILKYAIPKTERQSEMGWRSGF